MKISASIHNRMNYLNKVISQKQRAIEHAPSGFLKCNAHKSGWQYYIRQDIHDRNGTYIPVKNRKLACQLGQKDYDRKAIAAARKELKILNRLAAFYDDCPLEDIYESLQPARQLVVTPVLEPSDKYLKKWLSQEYEPKEIPLDSNVLYSDKGEAMRSKSEVLIANMLHRNHVPYLYERPLDLKGYGVIYPDFTILDIENRREIYWEHMGMLDDSSYLENALAKIRLYEQNGIYSGDRLVLTLETRRHPLDTREIEKLIRRRFRQYLSK